MVKKGTKTDMGRRITWLPIGSLLLLIALTVASVQVRAATNTADGGNGLRISPIRRDLTIKPGEAETVTISVTNVTAKPATFQAIINDFVANPDESGNPALILDPSKSAPKHGLKQFISPVPKFTLGPGQQTYVQVKIAIPATAAGGGYFGAIRFASAASNNDPRQNVSLSGSVGTLLLVKVPGELKEQLSLVSFDARVNDRPSAFFFSGKHVTATVRFQNQGNVQIQPFGKILLKDRSGKTLYSAELNNTELPANVLPDSIRKFSVPMKHVGGFGQYKLIGNFGYGSGGQLLTASTTFYIIPLPLIILFIALVLFIAFLIFGLPRLVRAYNRRILRRAGRR